MPKEKGEKNDTASYSVQWKRRWLPLC